MTNNFPEYINRPEVLSAYLQMGYGEDSMLRDLGDFQEYKSDAVFAAMDWRFACDTNGGLCFSA